jgi:hypothetical protein
MTHQFISADGLWMFTLGSSHVTLKTRSLTEPKDFLSRIHRIADLIRAFLQTSRYQVVRLQYLNAVPLQSVKSPLFSDWASALNENVWKAGEEFAQYISGVFREGGQYRLRYGIREPFYLSDAIVSVKDVERNELDQVLIGLDAEGLRLLALPIALQALKSLKRSPKAMGFPIDEWLNDLWKTSPEFEAVLMNTNTQRLELLARKYGKHGFSSEDEDRLAALTEQVRELIPRVTGRDWEFAHEIASRVDETDKEVTRMRRKYGLNG